MSKGVFFRGFQLVLIAIVFPQATFQNTAQHHSVSTDSTNSSVSSNVTAAALNATFADGSAVFPTDATIEPIISPSVTDSTQSITDQTPLSTDLSPYPFTFTDNAPIITNQSRSTTASINDLRAEMNSSYPTNSTDSSATATPKGTFIDGRAVLPTDAREPMTSPLGCLCDVTPDFCDIGCCCDVMDCGLLNLSSVFNNCGQDAGSGVCLESWLMLRTQIDPALVTLTGNLLCVQREEEKQSAAQTSSARFQPKSIYPFLLRELTAFNSQTNKFYKADDIILTYYDRTSIVSTLGQPSPGPASSACINHNPARFLRSNSLSCSRAVTAQSCADDRSLNALTYYTGFGLLRVPSAQVENSPEFVIPISTVSNWPEPLEQNGSCLNVVSKVEYVIEYTSKGEIAKATLNTELLNTTIDTQLQQKHVIIFQLATLTHPMATPIPPSPPEGLKPESLLVGWFGEKSQALTVLGLSEDGGCSADLGNRIPVLFKQNTVTGCTFRSLSSDCGVLRAELLGILAGVTVPDMISMTAGSQTDQSRVISQDCSTPASEACETGCLLPVSLSLQVLWAQRGLRALPQNHILGAKFIFGCQRLKCPLRSSVPLTTEVMFSDATVYPEAPGGERQPEWKFPFDFFSRGVGEFDQE
ncbi:tectonic-3-like isoform X2 [Rhinichthys klamathensis goyatoka]|uniref:tectonic-3-like isoform X2 n=1 Tax=Rhinichthys klamathensis goyatoka TaxID=3034132 RepID=UPI0024B5A0F2|nr:tectonic-3-like isoform X2 [Rhinichthys klamathensis goyatoka]